MPQHFFSPFCSVDSKIIEVKVQDRQTDRETQILIQSTGGWFFLSFKFALFALLPGENVNSIFIRFRYSKNFQNQRC